MSTIPAVHEWTARWWESLPAVYQALDATQLIPKRYIFSMLNHDPFLDSMDGWTADAPKQGADEVSVRLYRVFYTPPTNKPLHFTVWWEAAVPGGTVEVAFSDGIIASSGLVDIVAGEHESIVTGIAYSDMAVTCTVTITLPTGVDSGFSITALSVATELLTLESLPSNEPKFYPLLRWMDGVGGIAGGFRQISDDLYNGVYANPDLVPDSAVYWLALMLGVPPKQRGLPAADVRGRIKALVSSGRTAQGTRKSIEETVQFLLPGSMAWVRPHSTLSHVLVLYLRPTDLQGYTVQQVRELVMDADVIPAGHDLQVVEATATWDNWQLAVGNTWEKKETNAPRWVDSDAAGVVIQ